jgi:putative transposase
MRDWHHAPVHRLGEAGAYIVTAGTYQKQHFFASPERLTILHDRLLDLAQSFGWMLQAWALFSNHYHFVGIAPPDPASLRALIRQLHWETAVSVNDLDGTPGRKVWFNYWDKLLTFEKSYLVRLNYVHYNPQKHGLCVRAEEYPWCSASWFEKTASPGFLRTVKSFRSERLNDPDPF